jgi:hypothetical protein
MKIKIEMEIESCKECPFHTRVYEQGYSATECTKLPPYHPIAEKGFLPNCPFLQKTLDKIPNL